MSHRRYKKSSGSRGRRDYSRSNSGDYYRRRRRDLSPFSDSEIQPSRHRRDRESRRPRSAHVRRYNSLDDSDAVYVERRRRHSNGDRRGGGYRRQEHRSGRRGREENLKTDIRTIFEVFAEVLEMVNDEKRIIDRLSGNGSRSSRRLQPLRLDDKQSAVTMMNNLYADACSINDALLKRSRRQFFEDLEGASHQSPRHERRKYRDERSSRSRYGNDREYSRRSDRGYRMDHGYDDDRSDYDRRHRSHRSRR